MIDTQFVLSEIITFGRGIFRTESHTIVGDTISKLAVEYKQWYQSCSYMH